MAKFQSFPILLTAAALLTGCTDDVKMTTDITIPAPRPTISSSDAFQTVVHEFTPAPGQFVNEYYGDDGSLLTLSTPSEAANYALKQLKSRSLLSLGAFGGYVVVGFDHSIVNRHSGYDIVVGGNAFEGSNEPGIVWVMQDSNGNSLPDDTWYQLRNSESFATTTLNNYSVTYYRPSGSRQPVSWTDSEGESGTVRYMPLNHTQDTYYPTWIASDSYTLTGTRIEARNYLDEASGEWVNPAYSWGFADNLGSDALDGTPQRTGFKIDNAIDDKGNRVNLEYIDFVKVQQAVQAQSGPIGENSCEITFVADYSLYK